MFRILVTFEDHESLLFTTNHPDSLDQIEQRFYTPLPWVFQTERGSVVVDRTDVDLIVIQRVKGNRVLEHRTIAYKEDKRMADEIQAITVTPVEEPEEEVFNAPVMVSAYNKFSGFREKFLKGRAEAESWEDEIIQKQNDYNKALREVHSELSAREIDAKALKEKIVGK